MKMIWFVLMRIYPEKILISNHPGIESKVYYVSGNEETLVNKICEIIILYFKKKNYTNIIKTENKKIDENLNVGLEPSLFAEKTISVHKKPKDIDGGYIENLNLENEVIIISHYSNKTNPKIKKYFDNHKSFCSIACYALMKDVKKKLIDAYFLKQSIKLESEAYWYFLENSSNKYQLLENELEKIEIYGGNNLSAQEIKKLTTFDKNEGLDALFFSILLTKDKLISIAKKTILTPSDAYLFLYRVGFFIDILSQCSGPKDAEDKLPKYLFKEKNKFASISNNITNKNISNIFMLLKKSELLIRKNSGLFLIISERFLLNLKKQLL